VRKALLERWIGIQEIVSPADDGEDGSDG